jgi:hypothetical protein
MTTLSCEEVKKTNLCPNEFASVYTKSQAPYSFPLTLARPPAHASSTPTFTFVGSAVDRQLTVDRQRCIAVPTMGSSCAMTMSTTTSTACAKQFIAVLRVIVCATGHGLIATPTRHHSILSYDRLNKSLLSSGIRKRQHANYLQGQGDINCR